MAYTTINKPTDYFNVVTWTGTSDSTTAVTGVGHQPDFIWIKNRDVQDDHMVYDAVRGGTKRIFTNSAGAEGTESQGIQSFDSDGFTTGSHRATGGDSGNTMVSWNWKAGTSFTNDASATGIGTIDSTGSSNQEAGFSIVSYTSNGSSNQSVAHNLGGVPEMIISKNRDSGSASYNYWTVYHHSLATANDKKLKLNTSDAASSTNEWGDTDPTSTVYSLHTSGDGTTNHSTDKIISYCFRSIKGYSKFSSYTGNGSTDGTFVYTGFSARWLMIKKSSASGSGWMIFDTKRNPTNDGATLRLPANASSSEATDHILDILSNGFKIRDSDATLNTSGATFIYMAFAENPFVTSTGVPATAR